MNNSVNHNPQNSISPQAALWTARGRGAVATVRFVGDCQMIDSGQSTFFQAVNGCLLAEQPIGDILFGHWGAGTPEEVVLCRISEDQLAIHCHGGEIAIQRILHDLKSTGVEIVTWNQLVKERNSCFDAEMCEMLCRTKTVRTANIMLQQQSGLLSDAFEKLSVIHPQQHWDILIEQLHELLKWSQFGLHLTTPWQVVIAGRPNVGKSSLMNQLAGFERTIVFDQPGTTRDAVGIELVFDGWLMQLVDTAGIRAEAISLEKKGIERSLSLLQEADCQVILLDQSQPFTDEDIQLLKHCPTAIIAANKCDLPSATERDDNNSSLVFLNDMLSISAITGEGVETLCKKIVNHLIPHVPDSMIPLPVTPRQIECLQRALAAANEQDSLLYQAAILKLTQ